jgi:hypothetical protein
MIAEGGARFRLHGVAIVLALLPDQALAVAKCGDTSRNIGAFGRSDGYQGCARLAVGRYLGRRWSDIVDPRLGWHHTFVGCIRSLHERFVRLKLPSPLTHLILTIRIIWSKPD